MLLESPDFAFSLPRPAQRHSPSSRLREYPRCNEQNRGLNRTGAGEGPADGVSASSPRRTQRTILSPLTSSTFLIFFLASQLSDIMHGKHPDNLDKRNTSTSSHLQDRDRNTKKHCRLAERGLQGCHKVCTFGSYSIEKRTKLLGKSIGADFFCTGSDLKKCCLFQHKKGVKRTRGGRPVCRLTASLCSRRT